MIPVLAAALLEAFTKGAALAVSVFLLWKKDGGDGMRRFAKLLKDYVAQHPPVCGDAQAAADQLYWAFMENHRSDNDKTKEYYAVLQEQVKLPMREYDEVLYTVSSLSLEYGRVAFMEGLKIGMLLMQEMLEE